MYTNNGINFNVSGEKEDELITLHRFKDNEIRETFSLEDEGDFLAGRWKKEEDIQSVKLDRKSWTDDQLNDFIKILPNELASLELTLYNSNDFSSLELDNGTLSINMYDGGTTGAMELHDIYHLLDMKESGEITFMHIHVETISTWLSMEDIESGMTEADLDGQNYHSISVELLNNKDGNTEIIDSQNLNGDYEANMNILESYIVFYHDGKEDVIGWNKTSNKLVKTK